MNVFDCHLEVKRGVFSAQLANMFTVYESQKNITIFKPHFLESDFFFNHSNLAVLITRAFSVVCQIYMPYLLSLYKD